MMSAFVIGLVAFFFAMAVVVATLAEIRDELRKLNAREEKK